MIGPVAVYKQNTFARKAFPLNRDCCLSLDLADSKLTNTPFQEAHSSTIFSVIRIRPFHKVRYDIRKYFLYLG